MTRPFRHPSPLDRALFRADSVLRAATGTGRSHGRPSPAAEVAEGDLSDEERRHAAGLMRVNHAGEVSAQALYVGQSLLARDPDTVSFLENAAEEEGDHLCWCRDRLDALDSGPSRLDPLWFGGALTIGMGAALLGDPLSLGFVEETERQVVEHLDGHLAELPAQDAASRAVVSAMRADEARHAGEAVRQGARRLPAPLRGLMRLQARVMTTLAYRY